MREENIRRVLANTTVSCDRDTALALAKVIVKLNEGFARSFPIRRIGVGEAAAISVDGKVQWWPEHRWVSRWVDDRHGFVARFDRAVRDAVGKGALAFRLSPVMDFLPDGPILWMNGYVVDRRQARVVGMSFNREIGVGRRAWW